MLTNMSRLPLNVLPVFRVVAELQNLRAAALQLHLTHSAVSQQIRTLETQLGFALFDRRARRLVLNPAGQALLRATEPALALLDEGVQAAAAAAAAGSGLRLRISVLPSLAQLWLLPRMARWHAHHPDIALEIETSQQVVDLHREGFHAALRFGRGPWAGQQSEPLFDTPTRMILVAAPATARRLAGADPQRLAQRQTFLPPGLPARSDWPPAAAGLAPMAARRGLALARATLAHEAGTPPRRRRARPAA
ncbi:putative LysR-family transcriptional regulator [Bordetella bronchiseptica MO211]|nr:putative LysR-family transcriptional regulator [Bordetella bronchiseptica MO211]